MLSKRELATIVAALCYWREEIIPHGRSATRQYLERLKLGDTRPLSAAQIVRLSKRLRAELERI